MSGCLLTAPAWAWTEPECGGPSMGLICVTQQVYLLESNHHKQTISLAIIQVDDANSMAAIMISDSRWSMPKRNDLKAIVSVDDYDRVPRHVFTEGSDLHIHLPTSYLTYLASGNRLYVELPGATSWYSLHGSNAAIQALTRAYASYAHISDPFQGAPQASDPFGNSPPQPQAVKSAT